MLLDSQFVETVLVHVLTDEGKQDSMVGASVITLHIASKDELVLRHVQAHAAHGGFSFSPAPRSLPWTGHPDAEIAVLLKIGEEGLKKR